jgi:hypothetical protein
MNLIPHHPIDDFSAARARESGPTRPNRPPLCFKSLWIRFYIIQLATLPCCSPWLLIDALAPTFRMCLRIALDH